MNRQKILKKYQGIKLCTLLLFGSSLAFFIAQNLVMLIFSAIGFIYFLRLKSRYKKKLNEEI